MKKILLIICICAVTLCAFTACNTVTPPGTCWADLEEITYAVTDNGVDAGTLTARIERNPEDKTIDGKAYNDADTKLTLSYVFGEQTMTSVAFLDGFTALASKKTVNTATESYTVSSFFSAKHYEYSVTKNGTTETGKIKEKGATRMDNELIYTILRSSTDMGAVSSSYIIFDGVTKTKQTVKCISNGTKDIAVPLPETDGGLTTLSCNEITINRTETPIGSAIKVYYTPASTELRSTNLAKNKYSSTKLPVLIIENNLTYTAKAITIG